VVGKKFISGASTRQTLTIKLRRGTLVGGQEVLIRTICSSFAIFQPSTRAYDSSCILK